MCHEARPLEDEDHYQRKDEGDDQVEQAENRKGGENVGPSAVRDFARVLDREKAEMGLFICLHAPTDAMRKEALSMKFANTVHGDLPRLQIVSIEDWFKGKRPALPPLEHLDTAAFAGRRHPVSKGKRPDPDQPQLPLSFKGGKSAEVERHFNRNMVHERQPGPRQKSLAV